MQDQGYGSEPRNPSPQGAKQATPVELAHQAVARMIAAAVLGAPLEDDTTAEPSR